MARRTTEARCEGWPWTVLERGLIDDRASLLLDIATLLCMASAHQRAAPPKPRGGQWRWRGSEERAGYGSASVSDIHAPFATEVECKMASVIYLGMRVVRPLLSGLMLWMLSAVASSAEILAELQMGIMQLARERLRHPDCAYANEVVT